MSDEPKRIVIKRKGGKGEGFHGGAWKIALADFMTTLMALFLVLWVIATATPQQLKGLSDYFSMPLSKAMAGGDKNNSSDSAIPGGGDDPFFQEGHVKKVNINMPSRFMSDEMDRLKAQRERTRQLLKDLRDKIQAAIDKDPELRKYNHQIRLDMSPDGLHIQLIEDNDQPMFELGSHQLAPFMDRFLDLIVPMLNTLPNKMTIRGHTDSRQFMRGSNGVYSNWELSMDRANAARHVMMKADFDDSKLMRVSGVADRLPLPGTKASDGVNRRIELIVLTPEATQKIVDDSKLKIPQDEPRSRLKNEAKRGTIDAGVLNASPWPKDDN